MINYKEVIVNIDDIYKDLLKEKYSFMIIKFEESNYILTKEKSFFKVNDLNKFLKEAKNDIYYKTIIKDNNGNVQNKINNNDLELYKAYLNKYRKKIEKNIYNNKYIFGSVAVKTNDGRFITTIRGKENLNEYTIVDHVNHENNIVSVSGKKATLNAPLLDKLFKNKKVKAIVHINHEYDDKFDYYEYAFPGTKRDKERNNETSFNIRHHGVFYLFDEENNIL